MAERRFIATILNGEGVPYKGIKVRLVRHVSRGQLKPLGRAATIPANGGVTLAVDAAEIGNDKISLQIYRSGKWENVNSPVSPGRRPSLSLGKIAVIDRDFQVGEDRITGLNLSKPAELTGMVKELQERRAGLEAEIAVKTENLTLAEKEIAELKIKLAALEKFKEEYDAKKTISLNKMLTNTAEQLKAAQTAASNENLGFAIGKVSMELKGLPVKGLDEFEFLDKSEILSLSQNGMSVIHVDFTPAPAGPEIETTRAKTPNVKNLGERMAARKLQEKGFVADIHYQTTRDESEEGRVLTQIPSAEEELEVGSLVEIYIGKLLEKEESEEG